ncbi:MAG: aminomethyltransferase family protein, partial [bacterium]
EHEYAAFRHAAGLIDVSPLFKYEICGPDSLKFLSRLTVRDLTKFKPGRAGYCCWCDDHGKVIDDGTVSRLTENRCRLTSTGPAYYWLEEVAQGFDVSIVDSTQSISALAIQGPTSRAILKDCCDIDVDTMRFFGVGRGSLDGVDVWVSRTGYTGDLGYEVWLDSGSALQVWDALVAAGRNHGLTPAGLDALDMARIEAGFILQGVDYFSAPRVVSESRKSSPYELDLGWMIRLDRDSFVGQAALKRESRNEPFRTLVGLELSWEELEGLYDRLDLPVSLPPQACRDSLPVYSGKKQVGQATSHTWSPLLKKSIALATVETKFCKPGTALQIEHTVE